MSNADKMLSTSNVAVLDKGSSVRVIGRGSKVDFILDQDTPAELLEAELRSYLQRSRGWFAGGEVAVDVGRRVLNFDELRHLRSIFEDEHNLKVARFECSAEVLQGAIAEGSNVPVSLTFQEKPSTKKPIPVLPTPLFVQNNCRSGMIIDHPGDVVIFGDVNPGSQVISEGDIVVLGTLRGAVHAGVKDNEGSDASILVLDLRSAHLRIGPHTYLGPASRRKGPKVPTPEIVHVRGGAVEVAPFTGKFQSKQERNLL